MTATERDGSAAAGPTEAFRTARDTLLRHRTDYEAARAAFSWPAP